MLQPQTLVCAEYTQANPESFRDCGYHRDTAFTSGNTIHHLERFPSDALYQFCFSCLVSNEMVTACPSLARSIACTANP